MKTYFFKQALMNHGWAKNVRVECENGLFLSVSENSQLKLNDIELNCVIPSMPNSHSHVFQRAMAGLTEYKTAENDSFWSWRELMYRYANSIDTKQLYHIARYTYSDMLAAGYSSVCEFHYVHRSLEKSSDYLSHSQAILKAANDVGISITLLPVLYTQSHMDGSALNQPQKRFELSIEEYIHLHQSLKKELLPNQNLGVCFHSLRAVSIEQMKEVLDKTGDGLPIHIHIAEQKAEVEQCLNIQSKRPVELLFEEFNVNSNWNLVHATHLSDNEIQLIASSGAIVVICPLTEANLGDGIFPLCKFKMLNGTFSIGSDSHIAINPFLELQTLEYSQRLGLQQRIIASTPDHPHVGSFLWTQAIKGGAKSCQQNVFGFMKGQQANWIELDSNNILVTSLPAASLLDTTIFVDSKIMKSHYLKATKYKGISSDIKENYKNTLKSLR